MKRLICFAGALALLLSLSVGAFAAEPTLEEVYALAQEAQKTAQKALDAQAIQNIMSRHVLYHCYGEHREEMEEIWVQEPANQATAVFGRNQGYEVGYDYIWQSYVVEHDASWLTSATEWCNENGVDISGMTDEEIIDADISTWLDRYRGIAGGTADLGVFRAAMPLGTGLYEKAMLHDLTTYLPDDVLTKVDRASMSVSLETRAPLLDYRIVEFALSLPLEYKVQDGNRKRILKDLLYREVPEEMIGKNKMGFRIPFAKWLREDYDPLVQRYFSDEFLKKQGLFDEKTTGKMLRSYRNSDTSDYAREIWTFLLFQMWYEHYFLNT